MSDVPQLTPEDDVNKKILLVLGRIDKNIATLVQSFKSTSWSNSGFRSRERSYGGFEERTSKGILFDDSFFSSLKIGNGEKRRPTTQRIDPESRKREKREKEFQTRLLLEKRKRGHSLKESLLKNLEKLIVGREATGIKAFLGPLNLIAETINDATGGDAIHDAFSYFKDWRKQESQESRLNRKIQKKKAGSTPSKAAVASMPAGSGTGFLYLGSKIDALAGEETGIIDGLMGNLGSFTKNLFDNIGNIMGSLGKNLTTLATKAAGIAGIAVGLAMAVGDGLEGLKKSEEWGTSKVSSFIGGFLGGTKSGWEGAFENMGKWAIAGAGIGMLAGGPVGALIGGLIGAAIGGILGFIGGENIAKALDKVGEFFVWLWDGIVSFFASIWNHITEFLTNNPISQAISGFFQSIIGIWSGEGSILDKIAGTFKSIQDFFTNLADSNPIISAIYGVYEIMASTIFGIFDTVTGLFDNIAKIWSGEDSIPQKIWKTLLAILKAPIDYFINVGKRIWDGMKRLGRFFSDIGTWIWTNWLDPLFKSIGDSLAAAGNFLNDIIVKPIGDFFGGIFSAIAEGLSRAGNWINNTIIAPLQNFFRIIFNSITSALGNIGNWVRRNLIEPIFNFIKPILLSVLETFADLFYQMAGIARSEEGKFAFEYMKSNRQNVINLLKNVGYDVSDKTSDIRLQRYFEEFLHRSGTTLRSNENYEQFASRLHNISIANVLERVAVGEIAEIMRSSGGTANLLRRANLGFTGTASPSLLNLMQTTNFSDRIISQNQNNVQDAIYNPATRELINFDKNDLLVFAQRGNTANSESLALMVDILADIRDVLQKDRIVNVAYRSEQNSELPNPESIRKYHFGGSFR